MDRFLRNLKEYDLTLNQFESKYHSSIAARKFLQSIVLIANIVGSTILPSQICSDPDDDKFIAAAIAGNATNDIYL